MKALLKKPTWFTVVTILCLVVVTLFATGSCDKYKESKLAHVKTELGEGTYLYGNSDTPIITISEDFVSVFVGFTFAAKYNPFETKVEIVDDILYMHIIDVCYSNDLYTDPCYGRRLVYYTFDFVFKYHGKINQMYKILLHQTHQTYGEEPIYMLSEGIIKSKNH